MKKSVDTESSSSIISKAFEWFVVTVLHVIPVIVPLFFFISNEEIFEFNKMLLVYACTILVGIGWIGQMLISKKLIFKRTALDIPVLIYLSSQLISTVFSIHQRTSILGYYTRFHGGLLSTITYIFLFYATYNFIGKKFLKSFFVAILIGSLLSALYAFPEHFGHSPSCVLLNQDPSTLGFTADCWIQDVQSRVFGTFGQPNWLAAYLILTLPLLASFVTVSTLSVKNKTHSSGLTAVGVAGIFLLFSTLLFTQSRSGFLGLGLGGVVFLVLLPIVIMKAEQKIRTVLMTSLLIAGFTAAGTAAWFGTPFTPAISSFFQSAKSSEATVQQPTTPLVEIGGTDSGEIRKIVWRGAIEVWKKYPFFGSGVETFAYSYYQSRPMEHNLVSEWDFLYNKAHNEILNLLATTGFVGLLTYLLFYGVMSALLLRIIFTNEDWQLRLLALGVLAGELALHVSNFFGFSTVAVTMTTHLMSGAMLGAVVASHNTQPAKESHISIGQITGLGIVGIIAVYLLFQVWATWLADHYFYQAKTSYNNNDFFPALNSVKNAIELSPKEPLYYELYSKITAQYAVAAAEQNNKELMETLVGSALQASDTTLYLNPVHLNFYKTRDYVLVQLGAIDSKYYDQALETLEAARKLAPTDPKLVYFQGVIEQAQERNDQAIQHLELAIQMKPNYEGARFLLGKLYEQTQQTEKANEQYQYILTKINPANTEVKDRVDAIATASAKKPSDMMN